MRDLHALALGAHLLIGLQLRLRLLAPLRCHDRRGGLHHHAALEVNELNGRLQQHRLCLACLWNRELHQHVSALPCEEVGYGHARSPVRGALHRERGVHGRERGVAAEAQLHALRHHAGEAADRARKGIPDVLHVLHKREGCQRLLRDFREQRRIMVCAKAKGIEATPCLLGTRHKRGDSGPSAPVLAVSQEQDGRHLVSLPPLLHDCETGIEALGNVRAATGSESECGG
mmetsp:Transcript_49566/g.119291  ORF Transcript_49566/g.119291 Transcript_49566/m.119291 type:complete len:230 (-) Transcript_49566:677-1366(-)